MKNGKNGEKMKLSDRMFKIEVRIEDDLAKKYLGLIK